MSSEVRLEIDVRAAANLGEPAHTAVTVFAPSAVAEPAVLAFGFPGGGYNRGYFDLDLELEGPGGSSEARWHAARGWWFVACDHLGVGESTHPDPESLTLEALAAANDATVRAVCDRLARGTLADELPPIDVGTRLGFGQSMGGCLTIMAQGRHRTFDGVGILGYSAIHTVLPTPGDAGSHQPEPARGTAGISIAETTAAIGESVFRHAFHWGDVPSEVVEQDLARYPLRDDDAPDWGKSATPPPAAVTMLSPGVVGDEAASITVPVLIAAGERDVVPDPLAEPVAYGSHDVCVYVAPHMAHMHNFAGTRELLWQRVHHWGDRIAAAGRCDEAATNAHGETVR
jgi:pimeloyl-ACP methyl ester carboxylesterase